jgi:hypothetical protein
LWPRLRAIDNVALAHDPFGIVLINEGMDKRKDELFTRAHDQLTQALAAVAIFPMLLLPTVKRSRT